MLARVLAVLCASVGWGQAPAKENAKQLAGRLTRATGHEVIGGPQMTVTIAGKSGESVRHGKCVPDSRYLCLAHLTGLVWLPQSPHPVLDDTSQSGGPHWQRTPSGRPCLRLVPEPDREAGPGGRVVVSVRTGS